MPYYNPMRRHFGELNPDATADDLDSDGALAGEYWAMADASRYEKANVLSAIRGECASPEFESCSDEDEMIQTLVRSLSPVCGLHVDSSREFWQAIDGRSCTRRYVSGFFRGACQYIASHVLELAAYDARVWVEQHAEPASRESASRFADQYGDSWENEFPEGCSSIFDVALVMGGFRESLTESAMESGDEDQSVAFASAFGLDSFPTGDIEYVTQFVRTVVAVIPPLHGQLDSDEEVDSAETEDTSQPDEVENGSNQQRSPRNIRLGRRKAK